MLAFIAFEGSLISTYALCNNSGELLFKKEQVKTRPSLILLWYKKPVPLIFDLQIAIGRWIYGLLEQGRVHLWNQCYKDIWPSTVGNFPHKWLSAKCYNTWPSAVFESSHLWVLQSWIITTSYNIVLPGKYPSAVDVLQFSSPLKSSQPLKASIQGKVSHFSVLLYIQYWASYMPCLDV